MYDHRSPRSDVRSIADVATEQKTESHTSYLLWQYIRDDTEPERQQLDRDSALGSDMADLLMEDSKQFEPLRDLEPTLREFAEIPETHFDQSLDFISKHAAELKIDQVELLLKVGIDFWKKFKNRPSAYAVIHQAALLHRQLTWTETDFQSFRSGIVQENLIAINSWLKEVSQSFLELTEIVIKEKDTDPKSVGRGQYAARVFASGQPIQLDSIPIRGTPGLSEVLDDRKYHRKPTQCHANRPRLLPT
jgi:hypothetical protein